MMLTKITYVKRDVHGHSGAIKRHCEHQIMLLNKHPVYY